MSVCISACMPMNFRGRDRVCEREYYLANVKEEGKKIQMKRIKLIAIDVLHDVLGKWVIIQKKRRRKGIQLSKTREKILLNMKHLFHHFQSFSHSHLQVHPSRVSYTTHALSDSIKLLFYWRRAKCQSIKTVNTQSIQIVVTR